jgi:FdhE protein
MGYVRVEPISPENLLISAEARWRAVGEARPELAPALALQRELLTLVIDLAATIGRGRLPRLSLPPRYLAAKLARAVPMLAGEPVPVPVRAILPTLLKLCEALAAGGAGDAALHIRDAIERGTMEPGSLLTALISRNQVAVRTGASHRGLAADLVWLVAELAVSPFMHLLQLTLVGNTASEELRAALDNWHAGHCPACGSWPAVAEAAGGDRTLRCSFCSSAWTLTAYACIYCGERGGKFVTAAPDESRKDRRVELCGNCGGYLKTIEVPELSPFPLLSISDIETTDLDVAAMEQGYRRPPLKEFSTRR